MIRAAQLGCRYLTAEVSDSGEVIREMPRTGTGPFPAQRSSFPVPASQYGFMARDTQFSSAPYGGSYGSAGTSQYGLTVRGSYYEPVTVPAREDAARGVIAQDDSAQDDSAQDDLAQTIRTVPRSGRFRPGWIWVRCPAPSRVPACTPGWCSPSGGRRRPATAWNSSSRN